LSVGAHGLRLGGGLAIPIPPSTFANDLCALVHEAFFMAPWVSLQNTLISLMYEMSFI
jgi:hypothetical protein